MKLSLIHISLTDSMPGITRAVQYALRRYGIQVDDLNVLKPFVGPPLPESFKEFYDFPDHDAHEAVFVFREYYNVKGWMENAPFPGCLLYTSCFKADDLCGHRKGVAGLSAFGGDLICLLYTSCIGEVVNGNV